MAVDRLKRVNELLRREIAEALFTVVQDREADLAAVTITRVRAARNLRNARVFVSVRGTEADEHNIIRALQHHRREIQSLINRDMQLKYTPRLSFELDGSVAAGDHMLALLEELQVEEPDDGESGAKAQ